MFALHRGQIIAVLPRFQILCLGPFNGRSTICLFVTSCPSVPDSVFNSAAAAVTSIRADVSPRPASLIL